MSVTRTLPMPRRPKTVVVVPARRPLRAAGWPPPADVAAQLRDTLWPPPGGTEGPEVDRTAVDSPSRKHASAGSGAAAAPTSTPSSTSERNGASGAPIKAPQKAPVPLTRYQMMLALLRERWPAIFAAARPLRVGIHRDLYQALGPEISKADIRAFLAVWVRRRAYIRALAAGVRRVDLAGNDAGAAWLSPAEMRASFTARPGKDGLAESVLL